MSIGNDVVAIEENLILKRDGSVWALYQIPSQFMSPVADDEKEKSKKLLEAVLTNLKAYGDFDLVTVPLSRDLVTMFQKLSRNFASDTRSIAEYVATRSYEYLKTKQELYRYQHYLAVPLKSYHVSVDLTETLKQSINALAENLANGLGLSVKIPEGWELGYTKQREELEKQIRLLNVSPLVREENIFINRYLYTRDLDMDKTKAISLVDSYIGNLGDSLISFEHLDILQLTTDDGSRYVASLPVAKLPENMSYVHLMEKVQNLGFPVESFVKVQFSKTKGLPVNNIRFKGSIARSRLKNTQQESAEAGSVGKRSTARDRYLVEEMDRKIDDGVQMVSYLHTLTLSDSSLVLLKKKIEILVEALKDSHVGLARAYADQLYLFSKNKFGELLLPADKNFIQVVEAGSFAENLFFVDKAVGQETGFYLGKIDSQVESWHGDFEKALTASDKPLFVNIFEANKEGIAGKETGNPHIQVSGDSSMGKSFMVSLIQFYSSLLAAQTLYIDPKREKRSWYTQVLEEYEEKDIYPEIQDYIRSLNFVTLDSRDEANWGVLDPLVFLSAKEAKGLITSMLGEIVNLDGEKAFRTALSPLIKEYSMKRARGEQVGTLSILKALQQHENQTIRETADFLVEEISDSILSLVFSEGQNPAVDLKARNTILEIAGLELPDSEFSSLTPEHKKSMAVMYALGRYCLAFGERDYSQETVVFLDEAWVFKITAYGRSIIDRLKRMGRSQNAFLVFVSQEPDDSAMGDGRETAFGTYFCFKNDAAGSDEKILKRLKVNVTKESRAWYNNMTKAQCLYKDTYGRVQRITIDGFMEEVNKMFQTVKTRMVV